MLKEREAQIEMKKIMEEMRKEQEDELKEHIKLIHLEKEKAENEKFLKKQMELDKVTEFNRKK